MFMHSIAHFHPRLPPNALHFTADAIQHQQAAIWVYQRSDPPFAPTGTTLEVAHCAFAGVRGGDLVRPNSPMWFFVVPGSGVSVDVGRTLHASPERFGAARVHCMVLEVGSKSEAIELEARAVSRLQQLGLARVLNVQVGKGKAR